MRLGNSCFALALVILLAVAGRAPTTASADAPNSPDERALRLERTLACPQCTNLPLDICDQDICSDMRTVIRQRIDAGDSDAAIRQYFVARYGARVLLAPPRNAVNLLAWWLPFAALAGGAAATLAFIRYASRGSNRAPAAHGISAALGTYHDVIERDLRDLE